MGAQFRDVAVSISSTALTIGTLTDGENGIRADEFSRRSRRLWWVGVSTRAYNRKEPEMILQDKVAVIYGAGGGIGSAVSRSFASEGAKVFLTGLHAASV